MDSNTRRVIYADSKIAVLVNQSPLQQLVEEIEKMGYVAQRHAREALVGVIMQHATLQDEVAVEVAMKYKSNIKVLDMESEFN